MGEIMGMGLSHYPGPLVAVEHWPSMLQRWVELGRVKADLFAARDRWPEAMRQEWGNDEGVAAARVHRDRLLAGYVRLRQALDAFKPDIVLVWGDDQYENFKRDCIPAFCVGIYDKVVSRPYGGGLAVFKTDQNVWGLSKDTELPIKCHSQGARGLTQGLLEGGFDVAYSSAVRHPGGLAHSFNNTVIYLDYEQKGFGFPYPIIPFHVNCYGSQLIKTSASVVGEGADEISPPSPSPARCFEIGRATARYFAASPWRVALIGSASWSHGSLTQKHGRLYPDLVTDRARYDQLRGNRFGDWGKLTQEEMEDSGQHEVLNWICLAGAMTELGQSAEVVDYVETYVFNSAKCFALFSPHGAGTGASGAGARRAVS
ncbi:MAG TPA: hypothetical protein VGL83_20010 [Stellaceae bacterium]|jgi:hypothetical protein